MTTTLDRVEHRVPRKWEEVPGGQCMVSKDKRGMR